MKLIVATTFLFFVLSLNSQSKPGFFPEDVSKEGLGVQCFCKPGTRDKSRSKGLVLSYTLLGNGTFEDEDNSVMAPFSQYSSWERLEMGVKIPVINKERFKALLGLKYESEVFNINTFGVDYLETFKEIDATRLKKSSLSVLLTRSLNENNYLAMRLGYSANGNFDGLLDFNKNYGVYKALALFGVKPHEDFEWGIGVSFSTSFRRTSILPFFVYNRNFNNKWGIESVFPANAFLRYNLKPTTILLGGFAYNSESYRLMVNEGSVETLDYGFNHSEMMSMIRLEQQIVPWVWANAKLGLQYNFSTDFESNSLNTTPFMVEPTNGLFFEIGIFISPPDMIMGKK